MVTNLTEKQKKIKSYRVLSELELILEAGLNQLETLKQKSKYSDMLSSLVIEIITDYNNNLSYIKDKKVELKPLPSSSEIINGTVNSLLPSSSET